MRGWFVGLAAVAVVAGAGRAGDRAVPAAARWFGQAEAAAWADCPDGAVESAAEFARLWAALGGGPDAPAVDFARSRVWVFKSVLFEPTDLRLEAGPGGRWNPVVIPGKGKVDGFAYVIGVFPRAPAPAAAGR